MFEDATFDSRSIQRSQAPRWMLLTLTINLGVVATMIVLPLMYPASLPTQLLQRALYVPTVPAAAEEHPAAHQASASASPLRNLLLIPNSTLPIISREPVGEAPSPTGFNVDSGVPGGDGVPGGSTKVFQPNPPPVIQKAQPATMTISGGVLEGMLISKTTPAYPTIARAVHASGTVVLAATISKEGMIENLHVLSGHPLLTQAALDAVKTWRYRPFLLNGQPVEVETTINVIFSMAGH
jgi:protein TonB